MDPWKVALDTLLAENTAKNVCSDDTISVLDGCVGHAVPYQSDASTDQSTRVGTAADGNRIYRMYIDRGVLPTDLDACCGRSGVTPDSNG